jgi:hypothetical protein
MDCIFQYQIHFDVEEIYSQSHALRESFLIVTFLPDTIKNCDPWSHARFEDIWNNLDTAYPSAWMVFDEVQNTFPEDQTPECPRKYPADDSLPKKTIKMKIDFGRFLPLSGIKYLPAFVQNLQLNI